MGTDSKPRRALLVVRGTTTLSADDRIIRTRLERLGYLVTLTEDSVATNALGHAVVVCSSVVGPPNLQESFCDLDVPMVILGASLYPDLGMAETWPEEMSEEESDRASLRARLEITDSEHSMAAGLSGVVKVLNKRCRVIWARPGPDAIRIAALPPPRRNADGADVGAENIETRKARREKVVVFGYEGGANLLNGERAPARRVGMFFDSQMAAHLNNYGWALFDAAVHWAVGEELKQFREVFREEWQEIRDRRQCHGIEPRTNGGERERAARHSAPTAGHASGNGAGANSHETAGGDGKIVKSDAGKALEDDEEGYAPENLVGLSLSGGGIRSATFCLGLLQGLQKNGVLRVFDYVSTVSGGGYLGGWWSAWLARYGQYSQARGGYPQFALHDINSPQQLASRLLRQEDEVSRRACRFFENNWPDFLREFSRKRGAGAEARKEFVNHLNKLLSHEPLADEQTFTTLTGKTREIEELWEKLKANDGDKEAGGEVAHFNRLLLEQVFREEISRDIFPPVEKIEPVRSRTYFSVREKSEDWPHDQKQRIEERAESVKDTMCAGHDPIHHLRLFANYLTPRKGLFSKDTWRAITVVSRNLVVTWFTLIPILIAAVLAGQLYFALWPPHSETKTTIKAIHELLNDPNSGLLIEDDERKRICGFAHDFVYPYSYAIRQLKQLEDSNRKEVERLPVEAKKLEEKAKLERLELKESLDEVSLESIFAGAMTLSGGEAGASDQGNRKTEQPPAPEKDSAQKLREEAEELRRRAGVLEETLKKLPHLRNDLDQMHRESVKARGWKTFYPLALLLSLIVAMISAWMISNTSGSNVLGWLGGIAFWLLIACWLAAFMPEESPRLFRLPAEFVKSAPTFKGFFDKVGRIGAVYYAGVFVWLVIVGGMIYWAARAGRAKGEAVTIDEDAEMTGRWRYEFRRTRMTQVQTRLVICFVVTASVLLLAGFGHELWDYARTHGSSWATRVGGFTVLTTIVGAIYTAIKASPVGGGDDKETSHPSLANRAVYALTPPLVLLVLAVMIAGLAHAVFTSTVREHATRIPPLTIATFIGAVLCVLFAVYEIRWRRENPDKWLALAALLILLFGGGVFAMMYVQRSGDDVPMPLRYAAPVAFAAMALCLFVPRLLVDESKGTEDSKQRSFRFKVFESLREREFTWKGMLAMSAIPFAAFMIVGTLLAWLVPPLNRAFIGERIMSPTPHLSAWLAVAATATLLISMTFAAFEIYRGTGSNRRSLWLLASVAATMLLMMAFSLFDSYDQFLNIKLSHAIVGLLALSLSLVIALGWLADPNAISMHQFYRDRLIRAYLGASNADRGLLMKQVTEPEEGDDVMLWQLKNCQRGAPYHLVNTTLNLAAGRDLTTVQRSSAMFVLSKRACGSTRTGYRGTRKYMDGRLSLGTAIAASGAAASPNMGSRTPSSALAMLMTILNVRLGYWAPTPNKDHWRKRQPQLWPFYVLREFLSQTNELSAYSYLTDGGHFDNTGLYSLVERGCRFIVAADCGADPEPCFSDLGDAIRRCRIDFDAEIDIDITPLLRGEEGRASAHFVVGRIIYSEKHARRLKWKDTSEEARRGVIVLFKPTRVGDETADVRQYATENDVFPHQTTGDQWFDESQFESYRRLGAFSADAAFGSREAAENLRLNEGAVSLEDIEKLFDELRTDTSGKKDSSEISGYLQARFRVAVEKELDDYELTMTRVCEARMHELIANGAGVLAEMKAQPSSVDAAEKNLRAFVRELSRQIDSNGETNGAKRREVNPKAFRKAFEGLMFPFR